MSGSKNNSVSSSSTKGKPTAKKLGVIALMGIVVSAMMGGGIYSLPQNMAENASAGSIIVAWLVTGLGVWFIANTFRILSTAKPELKNGLYTYADAGFGKFIGFFVAYGYWICNCFALVAYSILTMETINYFFPYFSGGNNIPAIIAGSVITWLMFLLTLNGAKQTGTLSVIGTISNLVPIMIFIIALVTIFKFSVFMTDLWGTRGGVDLNFSFENVMPQVRNTMLVTLWLFIGIEGAVVVSGRAKSQNVVRKSTTLGYIITLLLYFLVSLLPLGVYPQSQVAGMANPSAAQIMNEQFGSWGGDIINFGVLVSVLSSWLVWMLMLGEMPFAAAQNKAFPKVFLKENKKNAPNFALLVTTIIIQVILILSYFAGNAWDTMISITSVMSLPCYLACTLYLFKVVMKNDYPEKIFAKKNNALITGALGSIYGLWLVYAAGLNYMMIACIIYAIGIPIYAVSVKENNKTEPIFTSKEKIIAVIVILLGIAGIIYSVTVGIH